MKPIVKAHTDGSCLGNPGVGGFASIIDLDGVLTIVKGYSKNPHETNNSMELKPVKHTIAWIGERKLGPCVLEVYTDSQYLCSCWKHDKYWLMCAERPNAKDWIQVVTLCEKYKVTLKFIKVQGHAGVAGNESADKLAREQAIRARHIVFGGAHE